MTSVAKTFSLVTIYRPPGPVGNFFVELGDFLATLSSNDDDFILAGDFNIHMDKQFDPSSRNMISLLNNLVLFNMLTHQFMCMAILLILYLKMIPSS